MTTSNGTKGSFASNRTVRGGSEFHCLHLSRQTCGSGGQSTNHYQLCRPSAAFQPGTGAIIPNVDSSEVQATVSMQTPELPEDSWREAREKTQRAQELSKEAAVASRVVVTSLRASGYTMRDIAAILGLSHQRVSQLAHNN